MTARDIVQDALRDLGVLAAGETATAEDAELGRVKLARLLDGWNATRRAVYAQVFNAYTLTPSLTPHTIGPSGTFTVVQRPVSIESATLRIAAGPPAVYTPITVRDVAWWRGQSVPGLTSTIPTDVYYEPAWPNGKLHFWPVPLTAYGIELDARVLLSILGLNDPFSLPPGYQEAVTLSLAERLLPSFPTAEIAALIIGQAQQARAVVFDNNDVTPRIATRDAGMPGSGAGGFNWITREFNR